MKRSEMIELISAVIQDNFDGNNGSWYVDAEKILDAIEDKGMIPPRWNNYNPSSEERKFGNDYDFCRDSNKKYYLICDGWESEDV